MTKIVISQFGEQIVEKSRVFCVEVPDKGDVKLLDSDCKSYLLFLERLANDAGIDWVDDDEVNGVCPVHYFVQKVESDDEGFEGHPVIQITSEMLDAVNKEQADMTA